MNAGTDSLIIATADHRSMVTKFEKVMKKMAVLGHNPALLTDCSEVIPIPSPAKVNIATFPAGKSRADVQHAVSQARCA